VGIDHNRSIQHIFLPRAKTKCLKDEPAMDVKALVETFGRGTMMYYYDAASDCITSSLTIANLHKKKEFFRATIVFASSRPRSLKQDFFISVQRSPPRVKI
jgi:hypothetical protein